MSDKQRKLRLVSFLLLSVGVFALVISCQSQRQVASFDQSPTVVAERKSGAIGARLKGPERTSKDKPGFVQYDEYLTFAKSFGFNYAAAGRAYDKDGKDRTADNMNKDSESCVRCHGSMASGFVGADGKKKPNAYHNMHDPNQYANLVISCVDCHGGSGNEFLKDKAHVQPNPETRYLWEDPKRPGELTSANPQNLGAASLKESPDFIRFVNPGDLRASWVACYACHTDAVEKNATNIMAHGAMLWEAALYNNGAVNRKNALYGEVYAPDGSPARVVVDPKPTADETRTKGWLPEISPLPRWEVTQPGNILRVFERGGERRPIIGLQSPEELAGHPDVKLSVRGLGTELRTDPVYIGLQKTRLLDPTLNEFGTNDHPGDYRSSGCTACHVVYANDRSPVHSGVWGQYGNSGKTASADFALVDHKDERGHPVLHYFVQQMPVSTCIVCHIHPGTNVVNSYTGYMWWDNETDGRAMYPAKQRDIDADDEFVAFQHNPEQASARGLWSDLSEFAQTPEQKAKFQNEQDQFGKPAQANFLEALYDMNDRGDLKHTRFADYHGHGWVFRAVYKKDRHGNLLDADGQKISEATRDDLNQAAEFYEQPDKSGASANAHPAGKPVHLKDIHLEKGMQCADCHFEQDSHGDGHLYGETRSAVSEDCVDCHGAVEQPAAILRYLNEDGGADALNTAQNSVAEKQRQLDTAQKKLDKDTADKKPPAVVKADQKKVEAAQKALDKAQKTLARIKDEYNHILTGSAAKGPPSQYDLKHFTVDGGKLYQVSNAWQADPKKADELRLPRRWLVVQTVDTVNKGSDWAKGPATRPFRTSDGKNTTHLDRAAYAHTVRRDLTWGEAPDPGDTSVPPSKQLAHANGNVSCYACHTSWNTSCFGCHLPMRANQKKRMLHNEGIETRNYTNYNYQTLRDDMYMLGRDGTVKGNKVVPVRSACAVMVSSQDALRRWIYIQQQTVSAEGLAGTAFSPYYPHTVRATETRECSDCHIHKDVDGKVDNNAVMAQVLMQGVNGYNFIGKFAWVGCGEEGLHAVAVAERDEPEAVIGSRLHEEAFPDNFARHRANGLNLTESYEHEGEIVDVQQRGEYVYTACGSHGFIAYDIANVDNKDFSERISTSPVSPLGQRFYVESEDATSICSPSTMALNPAKQLYGQKREENEEQAIHPLYAFLYLTDAKEGLIVIGNPLNSPPASEGGTGAGVSTLLDGNPDNNFLQRALTYNPDGALRGARHCDLFGHYAWISCDAGIVVLDLNDPLHPRLVTTIAGVSRPKRVAFQFRYAFVVDAGGMKVFDVTDPASPVRVEGADVPIADARDIYLCRTYAYVAAGREGLKIIDIEKPEAPRLDQTFSRDPATGVALNDTNAVKVAMTNASMFAYVADGRNGLKVLQITSSDDRDQDPGHSSWEFLGFSPHPHPRLVAQFQTPGPALCIGKGLDRDRAVDESGHQLGVFGRRGSRPFTLQEQKRMYHLTADDGSSRLFTIDDLPSSETRKYEPDTGRFDAPYTFSKK